MKKILFALGTFIGTLQADGPNKSFQRQVIAAVIWSEARSEGYAAMRAVAEVIRNRTRYTGLNAYAVVTAKKQFSCLNGTTPVNLARKAASAGNTADRNAYVFAETLAEALLDRTLSGTLAAGASHYHDDSALPDWAGFDAPVAKHGSLWFYKLLE
jgi:spore germination cell wall hydrolase CwlJ-like protein